MSTAIILPTLSRWAVSHLTTLLESKTQTDFDNAFEATFAKSLDATVNDKKISRDQYKAILLQQSGAAFEEEGTSVQVNGQTQVLSGTGQLDGMVGMFYTSVSDSKFLVLGAPTQSTVTSSINLTIKPTEPRPQSPIPNIRGYFDPRRVTTVNQVTSENAVNLSIPASSIPQHKVNAATSTTGKVELGPGPLVDPGVVRIPGGESGAVTETIPGYGEFGPGPVLIAGATVGGEAQGP